MRTLIQNLPDPLPLDPLPLAATWLRQAWDEQVQPNPNAMVLATSGPGGRVSARVVLCKDLDPGAGHLVFYTNYESRKARELADNPRAAAVFHWDTLHRQLRVEGLVAPCPAAESDDYFASRSWRSRLGAWASRQSRPVGSRQALVAQLREAAHRFGAPDPGTAADAGPASCPSAATARSRRARGTTRACNPERRLLDWRGSPGETPQHARLRRPRRQRRRPPTRP